MTLEKGRRYVGPFGIVFEVLEPKVTKDPVGGGRGVKVKDVETGKTRYLKASSLKELT